MLRLPGLAEKKAPAFTLRRVVEHAVWLMGGRDPASHLVWANRSHHGRLARDASARAHTASGSALASRRVIAFAQCRRRRCDCASPNRYRNPTERDATNHLFVWDNVAWADGANIVEARATRAEHTVKDSVNWTK
ncbi:MAG TPA: hypothetical protein VER96_06805 [Polyangiaceae bacterium]|nr:hypothetical protein [Polyangiaceae bacterium]